MEHLESRCSGKTLETSRGYAIYIWTGPAVEAGTHAPYTTSPQGSFDWKQHATLDEARAWIAAAPGLRKIIVELEAYVPLGVEATDEQIEDWVRFELHATGQLDGDNPLGDHGLEALDITSFDVRDVVR